MEVFFYLFLFLNHLKLIKLTLISFVKGFLFNIIEINIIYKNVLDKASAGTHPVFAQLS